MTGGFGRLELGEFKGVHGLKGLRVQVALDNPRVPERIDLAELQVASTS